MEEMDSNNLQEPLLQNEVAMEEGADSKADLKQEQRERVANKIMERLKMRTSLSCQEGLQELGKIAVRLEEKIYAEAASQTDYLRKISIQMMKLEANLKTSMAYSVNSNAASSSENTQDPASQIMQSQIQNQGQQFPTGMAFGQPQVQSQNIQNNISSTVVPNFTGSAPVLPSIDGKSQGTMLSGSVSVQNLDVQNMFNATPFSPMMQGWPTNSMVPFGQSQIQGGQQQIMPQSFMQAHSQQQQKMNLPQLNLQQLTQQQRLGLQQQAYILPNAVVSDQSQVQQQLLPQNIQNNSASTVVLNSAGLTPSTTQSHMQPQQKQNLLQPNQPMSQPLMSLNQSQPGQLQQQLYLQQANTLPKDWQQRLQSTGPVLQPQSPINQQKQLFPFHSQSERGYSKLKKKTVTALKKTHAMQQPQMPSNEGQVNSHTQSTNIQSSMVMPTQQNNTMSSESNASDSRPHMLGELQSGSNIDPGQSNVLNQTQQVATNSLQQNLVDGSQPMTRSISSQNGLTAPQSNASSLQSNSNAVQPQQINHMQQMLLSHQLMQQQYQQAHILQQQYMQKILLQQQQMMPQLIQQQQQQRQLIQHLVQKQSAQQTLQKQSAQQLIQQWQQTSQKQSEQQLILKQPPAPQQQQQTSQKQSAQHVIQLQEETSEMSSGQQMTWITAFLKLVCHVLIVVLLIMLMIKIGGMFLTQSFTGSYCDA